MIRIILGVLFVIITISLTARYHHGRHSNATPLAADLRQWQWQEVGNHVSGEARSDEGVLRTDVRQSDGAYQHAQVYHRGIVLKSGHEYQVVFSAKADKDRRITVQAAQDSIGTFPYVGELHPNADNDRTMGLSAEVPIDTLWAEHEFTFTAKDTDGRPNRLPQFLLGNTTGTVWIKDIAIREL